MSRILVRHKLRGGREERGAIEGILGGRAIWGKGRLVVYLRGGGGSKVLGEVRREFDTTIPTLLVLVQFLNTR